MRTQRFWDSWAPSDRRIFLGLGGLFLLVVGATLISYLAHPWPVSSWQQLQELQTQEIPVYTFERGSLQFIVTTDNYILFERWVGNSFSPNLIALDFYFLFFAVSLVVLLSLISILPRIWFYLGSLASVFLLSSFRWEVLSLGGYTNKIPIVGMLVIFLGILVYFHFFRTTASFLARLVTLALAAAVVALMVSTASSINQPLRTLAVNTLPAALVLLILFIIVIAHQLMASFVALATRSTQTRSLRQYVIISVIYLLNLWLAYLDRIGWMDWEYTIPGFVLLMVSGVLTVWNIRHREVLYAGIFKSEVYLTYFIAAFGMMAFATVGYFISSSNDIVMLSLSDLTIYTHLGYGMIFFAYVGSNFVGVFEKNLPVQKVLYKPTAMPYFTYRFAGLIVTLAFVFYNTWTIPLNHFISGYYTALGDLNWAEPTTKAFNYYRRGHARAPYNQHASTALAELEGGNGNYKNQIDYAVDANTFRPTEFTLLNADHLYLQSGNAYEDVRLLRRGKGLFPNSGVIRNNLGLAYTRIGMTDSAYRYLEAAQRDSRTKTSAALNLLGLITKHNLTNDPDSIYKHHTSDAAAVRSNAIAMANRQGKVLDIHLLLPKDSLLDLFTASLIANYLTNQITRPDTAFISSCVQLANKKGNQPFRQLILQSAAKGCYAAGKVNLAFELLQMAGNKGTNSYILGLWAMDQEKFDVALNYLYDALDHKSAPAALANAVSLAEEGRLNEAIIAWDTISRRKDPALNALGESMKRVLAAPPSWFVDLTEREKLYYALYQIPLADTVLFKTLVNHISDEDLRAKAFLNRARKFYNQDAIGQASRQFQQLQGLHLTDTRLFVDIKYFELRLLAAQRRLTELQAIIKQGIIFGPYRESDRIYFEALQQEASGDTLSAGKNYLWLANNNWYFDEGVVGAARHYEHNPKQSYTLLANALQVNPHSVRILKAYIPAAHARGFDTYAMGAMETLRGIIPANAFQKYITEKQLSGLLLQ